MNRLQIASRSAFAATLVAGLLALTPPAQADSSCDETIDVGALLAGGGGNLNIAQAVANLESCLATVGTPCPSQATAGADKPWEFYLLGVRDPVNVPPLPKTYYIASWSGVTHFDSACRPVAYQCTINVEDSSFQTVSVRNGSTWYTATTGSYHGAATAGGYAACGSSSASVNTSVLGVVPLVGYTV